MPDTEDVISRLGNEPPLVADGSSGPPDRREVSARWLSGTFLTGLTSSVLMGVALFAALDGRQQLATPPEVAGLSSLSGRDDSGDLAKTTRLVAPRHIAKAKDRRRMEVPMVTTVGDRNIIKTIPFVQVKMALAAGYATNRDYPPFDPMKVFVDSGGDGVQAPPNASVGEIYGAKVEGELSLKTVDFPIETASFDAGSDLSAEEIEQTMNQVGPGLREGAAKATAVHYLDPQRFGDQPGQTIAGSYDVRIVPQNLSVSPRTDANADNQTPTFAEEIIPLTKARGIAETFADSGYVGQDATGMAEAIAKLLKAPTLKAGTVLRVGLEVRDDVTKVVRTGVYDKIEHIVTIALDDRGQYVMAQEPQAHPELLTAFDNAAPVALRGAQPNVYDGIYRAAYSYGMSDKMTQQLVKVLTPNADFQSRVSPTDRLEVLFSQPNAADQPSDESELLYVSATLSGTTRNFYRFQTQDGSTDYFDDRGINPRQFLLRKPAPNGRFTSGFGGRRHPVLGYVRMHTGTDWAAPTGTPIIAAGNGVIEKAERAGGFGNQTIIRHANGYQTSYNHQKAFAKGIVPGATVRQGQIIGYVGSTGLSTGPHLHYELMVNNTKVDPLRVRLPVDKVLKADDLVAFQRERERIDALLKQQDTGQLEVASTKLEGCVTPIC
ncbi:MAG: M23 family metallopeptidase [Myxococcota bacterium]|jgi:murein DD-endopeptidase MepM/ murein hydrolase activator NlpD